MRVMAGVVAGMGGVGCAEELPARRQSRTAASEDTRSSVDPSAITPERQDAIERLFTRKAGDLQACWTEEYEKTHNRKLEGNVTLQLNIDATGKPGDVKILQTTLANPNVESCVIKAVAAWQFPEGNASIPVNRTVHLGAQF